MNRSTQSSAATHSAHAAAAPSGGGAKSAKGWKSSPRWLRILSIVLLFAVTVLVVSLLALIYFGNSKESDNVDTKKHQAVFLTNGQVYFGKINSINRQYVDLRGIYYLNVNQQVQPNQQTNQQTAQSSVTLVKLGCELHGPSDQMVINRDQVTFWENLEDSGQVAKAIDKWVDENPNGQKCATPSSNTNTTTKP